MVEKKEQGKNHKTIKSNTCINKGNGANPTLFILVDFHLLAKVQDTTSVKAKKK